MRKVLDFKGKKLEVFESFSQNLGGDVYYDVSVWSGDEEILGFSGVYIVKKKIMIIYELKYELQEEEFEEEVERIEFVFDVIRAYFDSKNLSGVQIVATNINNEIDFNYVN